jgi:hypothetical protein
MTDVTSDFEFADEAIVDATWPASNASITPQDFHGSTLIEEP